MASAESGGAPSGGESRAESEDGEDPARRWCGLRRDESLPLFVVATSYLQLMVFAIWRDHFVNHADYDGDLKLAVDATSRWPACRDRRREAWRYVGYQFVHVSDAHLFVNAAVQLVVGAPLEVAAGAARVAALYEAAVVLGALAHAAADPTRVVVGASGGVYGLVGAQVGLALLRRRGDGGARRAARARLGLAAAFVAVDAAAPRADRPAHAVHLGGAAAGLLLAPAVLGPAPRRLRAAGVAAAAAFAALCAAAAAADPVRGVLTPRRREAVYCCYQAAYCRGVDRRDYADFRCRRDGDRYVLSRLHEVDARDATLSCDELRSGAGPGATAEAPSPWRALLDGNATSR